MENAGGHPADRPVYQRFYVVVSAVSAVSALAVGFLRRRPPRLPLRVFLRFGCSPCGKPCSVEPRAGSGTWIKAGVASGSPFWLTSAATAGFFLRLRPPREPRRV